MLDIDPRDPYEEERWRAEKDEMDSDAAYWNWLALVEKRLNEELGENDGEVRNR